MSEEGRTMLKDDGIMVQTCGCRYSVPTGIYTHRCPDHDGGASKVAADAAHECYAVAVDLWTALNGLLRRCEWLADELTDGFVSGTRAKTRYTVRRKDHGDVAEILDAAERAHTRYVQMIGE